MHCEIAMTLHRTSATRRANHNGHFLTPMASQVPTIRRVSWPHVIPSLIVLILLMSIGYLISPETGIFWGMIAFVVCAFALREFVARAHRAGIRLTKQQRFEEAIPKFQESLAFFDRHPWVDRFRSLVLLSSSAMSYQEMGLANIAFCYTQIGQGDQARRYYQKCLDQFPDSGLATSALRMLDSVSQRDARVNQGDNTAK